MPDGGLFISGTYDGPITFAADPQPIALTPAGRFEHFAAVLRADGRAAWARRIGSGPIDIMAAAVAADGTIALAGDFGADVAFGDVTRINRSAAGSGDCVLAIYDATGEVSRLAVTPGTGNNNCTCDGVASLGTATSGPSAGKPIFATSCWFQGPSAVIGGGQPNATTIVNMNRNDFGDASAFLAAYDAAGTLQWAKGLGGGGAAYPVATPIPNGVAVAAAFSGTAQFAYGEPNATTIQAKDGEVFLAAYDSQGALSWVKQFGGGQGHMKVFEISAAGGAIYATSSYVEAITFERGRSNQQILSPLPNASVAVALARYGTDGAFSWATRVCDGHAVRVAAPLGFPDGTSAIGGVFAGAITLGVDAPAPVALTSMNASDDVFLARFDPAGQILWGARAGGEGTDGTSLSSDPVLTTSGRLYLGGDVTGTATFGTGATQVTVSSSSADSTAVFVAGFGY